MAREAGLQAVIEYDVCDGCLEWVHKDELEARDADGGAYFCAACRQRAKEIQAESNAQ